MSKILLSFLLIATITLSLGFFTPVTVQAAGEPSTLRGKIFHYYNEFAEKALLPKSAVLQEQSIGSRVIPIIQLVLGLMGTLFLVLVIYGGIFWMTAQGNEEQVKKAREIIKNAIIGLAIILTAYLITWFVGKYIIEAITRYQE